MNQHWVPILGNAEISNDAIALAPFPTPVPTPDGGGIVVPYAYVRSNVEFEQGIISLETRLLDSESSCQIGLGSGQGETVYAGLNVLGMPYGFAKTRNYQWEPILGTGQGSRLPINEWIKLRLHVQGSNLDLYFNDVKVVSTVIQIQKSPINLFLQGKNKVEVRNIQIEQQKPICFVVMQFTDEYNALYKEVIKLTCDEFGYDVVRADDIYTSGIIIDDITRSIQEAAIVIADITPNNPNVFYELGYAHGIGKPTILLKDRKSAQLPFDISGFRAIFYDNTIGGKKAVEESLKKHLANMGS